MQELQSPLDSCLKLIPEGILILAELSRRQLAVVCPARKQLEHLTESSEPLGSCILCLVKLVYNPQENLSLVCADWGELLPAVHQLAQAVQVLRRNDTIEKLDWYLKVWL